MATNVFGQHPQQSEFEYHRRKSSEIVRAQQRETLMCHELAEKPWEKVGVDLFTYDGHDFLITVGYFSISPTIGRLTRFRIWKRRQPFESWRGNLQGMGSQTLSLAITVPNFLSKNLVTSLMFGVSNIAPAVQVAPKEAKAAGEDPYLAMLARRNTPNRRYRVQPCSTTYGTSHENLIAHSCKSASTTRYWCKRRHESNDSSRSIRKLKI